jgi:hypothetical protein
MVIGARNNSEEMGLARWNSTVGRYSRDGELPLPRPRSFDPPDLRPYWAKVRTATRAQLVSLRARLEKCRKKWQEEAVNFTNTYIKMGQPPAYSFQAEQYVAIYSQTLSRIFSHLKSRKRPS